MTKIERHRKFKDKANGVTGRLPRHLPCIREGAIVEFCPSCPASAEGRHVRSCDLHDTCTRQLIDLNSPVRNCARCPDYIAEGSHPNIIAADEYSRNIPPYPDGTYSGRGVVIVGGGKYWPSAYVTARMLRHVGCALPAEVWYLGEKERDDRYADLLVPFGVRCVDILSHPKAHTARNLAGHPGHPAFNCKSFAALHSLFEEVLLLDADSYPCQDPTVLFDEPRYRASGGIFWPDQPQTNKWTKWGQWGVEPFGPNCGWEVGQYVLNKRIAWRELNLARWYDDHGDWCYGAGIHHDHGDKGSHRVAWAKFKSTATFFNTKARSTFAFIQPGPDGRAPMFIHRGASKFVLDPTAFAFASTPQKPNLRGDLPGEEVAFGFLEELRSSLNRSK